MHKRTKTLITEMLLTTEELSAFTGWSAAKINKDYHRGKLDAVLKGNILLFDRRDFRPACDRAYLHSPPVTVPKN